MSMSSSYASPQVRSLNVSTKCIPLSYEHNQTLHPNWINNNKKVGNSLSNSPIINRNKVQSRLSYLKKLFSHQNSVQNSMIMENLHKQNIQPIRSNFSSNQNYVYQKNHYRYASDVSKKEQIAQRRFKQVSLHLQSKQNIQPFIRNHSYKNSSLHINPLYDSPQKHHKNYYKQQYVHQSKKIFQSFTKQNKHKRNKSDIYKKNNINQQFQKKSLKKSRIEKETIEINKIQSLLKGLKSQIAKNHKRIVLQFTNLKKMTFSKGIFQKTRPHIRQNPIISGKNQVCEYFNPLFYKKTRLIDEQYYMHHRVHPKIVYQNKSII